MKKWIYEVVSKRNVKTCTIYQGDSLNEGITRAKESLRKDDRANSDCQITISKKEVE